MSIPIGVTLSEGTEVIQPVDNSNPGASVQHGQDLNKAAREGDPDETIGVLGPQIGSWNPERMVRDW